MAAWKSLAPFGGAGTGRADFLYPERLRHLFSDLWTEAVLHGLHDSTLVSNLCGLPGLPFPDVAMAGLLHGFWKLRPGEMRLTFGVAGISQSERAHPAAHLLAHLSLLNGLFPTNVLRDSSVTFLPPAWSISVEWQYYLLAPLIVRLACSAPGILGLTAVAWLGHRFARGWENPLLAFVPPLLPFFLIGVASYHAFAAFCASGARRSPQYLIGIAAFLGGAVLVSWHSVTLAIWSLAFGCLFVDGNTRLARSFVCLRRVLEHSFLQSPANCRIPCI